MNVVMLSMALSDLTIPGLTASSRSSQPWSYSDCSSPGVIDQHYLETLTKFLLGALDMGLTKL